MWEEGVDEYDPVGILFVAIIFFYNQCKNRICIIAIRQVDIFIFRELLSFKKLFFGSTVWW